MQEKEAPAAEGPLYKSLNKQINIRVKDELKFPRHLQRISLSKSLLWFICIVATELEQTFSFSAVDRVRWQNPNP